MSFTSLSRTNTPDERLSPPPDYDEATPLLKEHEQLGRTSADESEIVRSAESTKSVEHKAKDFQLIHVPQGKSWFSFKKLWKFTGPGFLMSIAYLDPGNIESDLQAGSIAQYRLLWVLLWSTVMGLILQLLSAKLGVVTGQHLAEVCRDRYPRVPRWILWITMELAIIGSDIQEVIGSALAISILSQGKIPLWGGCLITGVDTFTFLFLESYGLRYLEAFFGGLITIMCGMFGWMYIHSQIQNPSQVEVVEGIFVPWCQNCSKQAVEQGLGIVGAVIMPHNLYLHSGLVLSRAISRRNPDEVKEGIKYNSIESTIALFVSFFVNLFVICVFGAAVYSAYEDGNEYRNLTTHCAVKHVNLTDNCHPSEISLLVAHKCLYEIYDCQEWVKYIWAIGLLAAGQSSTMTGTYAGQFVMEGFLNIKWAKWKRVLLTRSIALVPCVIIAILARNSLDYLDNYINVEQSLLLPFSLFPLLHATSSKEVMGQFKNSVIWTVIVWIIALIVIGVNIFFIIYSVAIPGHWWRHLVAAIGLYFYIVIILYFAMYPLLMFIWKQYVRPAMFRSRVRRKLLVQAGGGKSGKTSNENVVN